MLTLAQAADTVLMPGESVADRPRPKLDPTGMPAGAFRLFPTIEVSAKRESNIFADRTDEVDDTIVSLEPALRLESDWVRHSFTAGVSSHIGRYRDNGQENFSDAAFSADLGLDLSRYSALLLATQYELDHEERYSPDDVFGIEPTEFDVIRYSAAYARRAGKVSLYGGLRQTKLDYDDVLGTAGVLNNDDRDRTETRYTMRAGYQVQPDVDVLIRIDAGANDYDGQFDAGEANRSADSRTAALGIRGALTGALYAEIFAGYIDYDYDDVAFTSIDSSWYEARVVWNPSGLTSVTLDGARGIEETTLDGASGYMATRLALTVDHELLRNLLLHAEARLQRDSYSGIDREDDNTWLLFGIRYLANRNIRLELDFRQRQRDSAVAAGSPDDFTNRSFMFSIRFQR